MNPARGYGEIIENARRCVGKGYEWLLLSLSPVERFERAYRRLRELFQLSTASRLQIYSYCSTMVYRTRELKAPDSRVIRPMNIERLFKPCVFSYLSNLPYLGYHSLKSNTLPICKHVGTGRYLSG